ncbi:unnamed protein product [Prunus brigantina]
MREIWRDFLIQNPEFKSYHNWLNCATSTGEIAFAARQIPSTNTPISVF